MPTSKYMPTLTLVGAALALGCATPGPSEQLKDARAAYKQAKASDAAQERPDELVDAHQALTAAEQAYEDDPGSAKEHHLAYLAQRRAQLALARGETTRYERSYERKRDQVLSSAKQNAQTARSQLSATQRALQERDETLTAKEQALAEERQKRKRAEAMASAALEDLQKVAMVKEESRGYVITLSGAVLFATGESELLQTARTRLAQVADALKQQADDASIVIEGHTDSRGSNGYNQELSLARANSVRDYLVEQGIDGSRLKATGVGEQQPIASNDTPEGRANNRRVEIIVSDDDRKAKAGTSASVSVSQR